MSNEIFQQVREFIVEKINPDFIIIFGSYAKGIIHSESDIDIAFYREDKKILPMNFSCLRRN